MYHCEAHFRNTLLGAWQGIESHAQRWLLSITTLFLFFTFSILLWANILKPRPVTLFSRLFPRRSWRGQVVRRVSVRPHREATSRNALVSAVAAPEKYHLRQDRELRRLRRQVERHHEQQALTRAECQRDAQKLLSDQGQEGEERVLHLAAHYQRREQDFLRRLEILSRRYQEADQGRRRLLEEHETLSSKARQATWAVAKETEKLLNARAFQIQAENNERLMKKRCEDLTQQVEQSDVQRRIHGEVITAARVESEQLRHKTSELEKNCESRDDSEEIITALRAENERLRGKAAELEQEVQIRDQDVFIISARASLEQLSRKVSDLESIVQRRANGEVNTTAQIDNQQPLQKTTELESDALSRINGQAIARALVQFLRLRRQVLKPKKSIRKDKRDRQLESMSQNARAKADSATPQKSTLSYHENDSRESKLHKVRGRASGFKHTAPPRRHKKWEGTASNKSTATYLLSMASGYNATSAHEIPNISSLPAPGTTRLLQSISQSDERENIDPIGISSVGSSPLGEEQEQLQDDDDRISSRLEAATNPDNPQETTCEQASNRFQEQEQDVDELVEEIRNLNLHDVIDVPDADQHMSGQSPANIQFPDQQMSGQSPANIQFPDQQMSGQSPANIQFPDQQMSGQSPANIQFPDHQMSGQSPANTQFPDQQMSGQSPANTQFPDQQMSGQSPANTQFPGQQPPESGSRLQEIMDLVNQARDYIQFWLSLPTEKRAQFIAENPALHPVKILSQVLGPLQELEAPFSQHDQEVLERFRSQPIPLLIDISSILMTFQSACQNLLGNEYGTLAGDCFEVCSQICDHLTSLHDGDLLSGFDLLNLSESSNEFDSLNELKSFPVDSTGNQIWNPDQKLSQEPKAPQSAPADQLELNNNSLNIHSGQPTKRPLEEALTSSWQDTDVEATSTTSHLDAQDSAKDDVKSHLDCFHDSPLQPTSFSEGGDGISGVTDCPRPTEPLNFEEDQASSESEDDWGDDDLWERIHHIMSCPSVRSQNGDDEQENGIDASSDLHRISPTQSSSFHSGDQNSERDYDDFWKDVYRTSPAQSPSPHPSNQSLGSEIKFWRDVYHTSPPPSPLQRDITSSSTAIHKSGEPDTSSGVVGAPHLNALLTGSHAEMPSSTATDSEDPIASQPTIKSPIPFTDMSGGASSQIYERHPSAPIVLPGLTYAYPSTFTAPPPTFETGSSSTKPMDAASQGAHEKEVPTHHEEEGEKDEEGEKVESDADDNPPETPNFIDGYRDGSRPSTAPPINISVPKSSGPADGRISGTSTSMSRAQQSQNSVSSQKPAQQSASTSSKSPTTAQQPTSSFEVSDEGLVASSKVSLLQSVKEGQDQEQEQQQEPEQGSQLVKQHVQQENQQKEPEQAQEHERERERSKLQEKQQERQRERPKEERPRAKRCRFCGEWCSANDEKHCGNDKNVPWPTLDLDNLEGMKAMTQMTPCDCGVLPGEPGHVRTCLWYAEHYDLDADLDPDLDSISDPDSDPELDPCVGSDMDG